MRLTSSRRALTAVATASALLFGFAAAPSSPLPDATDITDDAFTVQLVSVHTPTRAAKDLLVSLPLDLTEHAGHEDVEVVLHSPADAALLTANGFTWDVRIADMAAREAEIHELNAAYAAATVVSPLPSGRDAYRSLDDYYADLDQLASDHPQLVKSVSIGTSLEGKDLAGIEISKNVHEPEDGRPVFLMFGLHHAREWPSGENTIEFGYDLLTNYGIDPRITDIVDSARIILVPVSNPDGFEKSYNDSTTFGEAFAGDLMPTNAYKRKNCRVVDGLPTAPGLCTAALSPLGFGIGVDLNRNYGALWGGPGASDKVADPTYRGAAAFSEPETQAIRDLISSRQVTTLITNHTYSNLILRPNGVNPATTAPDGFPVGLAPDEDGMRELGAAMAAQNGYLNQQGWQLYDTTGTTEDYSYNATGGYGYTFEIGPDEFHPPFPEVIDEYLGAGEYAGKGNREAYLLAVETAIDPDSHSVLTGVAPAGATLRVSRTATTPTWTGSFEDTVETTMVVGDDGLYEWHVNPSTRPFVLSRRATVLAEEPLWSHTDSGLTAPKMSTVRSIELPLAADVLDLVLTGDVSDGDGFTDDFDLKVTYYPDDGGPQVLADSLAIGPEHVMIDDPQPGRYDLEIYNYQGVGQWHLDVGAYESEVVTVPRLFEEWTVTCEVGGDVRETRTVMIDRGEQAKLDFGACA